MTYRMTKRSVSRMGWVSATLNEPVWHQANNDANSDAPEAQLKDAAPLPGQEVNVNVLDVDRTTDIEHTHAHNNQPYHLLYRTIRYINWTKDSGLRRTQDSVEPFFRASW